MSGGANLIQQYITAGLVDELTIHLAPVLTGEGIRLFDRWSDTDVKLEPAEAVASPSVTHLGYRVAK